MGRLSEQRSGRRPSGAPPAARPETGLRSLWRPPKMLKPPVEDPCARREWSEPCGRWGASFHAFVTL